MGLPQLGLVRPPQSHQTSLQFSPTQPFIQSQQLAMVQFSLYLYEAYKQFSAARTNTQESIDIIEDQNGYNYMSSSVS